jgi:hypothetical protein
MEWKLLLSRFPTPEEMQIANDYFWSQDQIRGFDKYGKRIGTGLPRERNGDKMAGGEALFGSKSKKPHERSHGRPRGV